MAISKAEDLAGKIFGSWKVLCLSNQKSGGNTKWVCECVCGSIHHVQRSCLVKGRSTRCHACSVAIKRQGVIPLAYLRAIKTKSVRRGMPFDLTAEYLRDLYESQNGLCSLSGLPIGFHDGNPKQQKSRRAHSASLDRIDSSIGYLVGNVQWVHKDINTMKNTLSNDAFVLLCRLVSRHRETAGVISIDPDDLKRGLLYNRYSSPWDRSSG